MEKHFQDQISDYPGDLSELSDGGDFIEMAVKAGRNDIERRFRDKGKRHQSVIGQNNCGIESMDFTIGGELHNEIGISNNIIESLYSDLRNEGLGNISAAIKILLDNPKSAGGLGCTPGAHV